MTLRLALLATALAATTTLGEPASAQQAPETVRAGVCHAIDGDTLRCGSVKIRLLGIDAAELPGHCDRRRKCAPGDPFEQWDALKRHSAGPITIYPIKPDRHNRMVAQITDAAGNDLSCAMISAGATYAPRYDDGQRIARTCPDLARR